MLKNILKNLNLSRPLVGLVALGLILIVAFFVANKHQNPPVQTGFLPAFIGKIVSFDSDQILIKFRPNASLEHRKEIFLKHGLNEKSEIKQIGVRVVSIPSGQSARQLADRLMAENIDAIEFAEPNYSVEPSLIPNDPWFINWQKDKQQINVPAAWDATIGSANLTLAIVDTGVNCSHEDLSGQCVSGWNFYNNNDDTSDVNGHGTAVAGVAAAIGNNGLGIAGVVWQSKIMPLRVSAQDGSATYSVIADAITYAADHGARVVNNSYQTSGSATVRSAAGYLKNRGGLLVVSEGNYGFDTGYTNSPNLISVSAVDASDNIYSWSSFGDDTDVSAPGCTGAATLDSGGYGSFCGTSNAAPEVAGTLMLIWSVVPSLTPDQAQDILFKSAKDLGTTGWDRYYGWGRIDAEAAVAAAVLNSINSFPTPSLNPSPDSTSSPQATPSSRIKHTPKPRQ